MAFPIFQSKTLQQKPVLSTFHGFVVVCTLITVLCQTLTQMGVSRSCTCAMAYMMMTHGWTAVQTMRQFRANRDVRPNDGFMRYIVELDNRDHVSF